SAQPLLGGDLLNAKPFSHVPEWWSEAADYLGHTTGRTLLVPGLPQGDSTWGYTAEEPLAWLISRPWATRSLIPLGSYGAIRYLDAVEEAIARGGDHGLPNYLQRGGVATVMVRNDGNWRTYGAPTPRAVNDSLAASGLVRLASFGPLLGDDAATGGEALHEIELYALPDGAPEP